MFNVSKEQRIALDKTLRICDIFRRMDRTIPLTEMMTFIMVATDDSGTTLESMGVKLNTALSTMQRLVAAIGAFDRDKTPGLNLIAVSVDPTNFAKKIRVLTPKGILIVQEIEQILKEKS